MTITEKDVESIGETKPKKKWGKIILIVLAVWIGLGIVGSLFSGLFDDEEKESKAVAINTKALMGFENINFGAKKNDVLTAMKKARWTQINEGQAEMNGIQYQIYVFEKKGYKFAKHEVNSAGFTFENNGYFVSFSVSYNTENMTTEDLSKLIGDCTSISDFKLAAKNPTEDGGTVYGYQNSSGDICTVSYVGNSEVVNFEYWWHGGIKR
ncbi:MAG: hypothetical protein II821_03890 [Treponema sp.]|nr:hypothetical protein [Treponema sp.]